MFSTPNASLLRLGHTERCYSRGENDVMKVQVMVVAKQSDEYCHGGPVKYDHLFYKISISCILIDLLLLVNYNLFYNFYESYLCKLYLILNIH